MMMTTMPRDDNQSNMKFNKGMKRIYCLPISTVKYRASDKIE